MILWCSNCKTLYFTLYQ